MDSTVIQEIANQLGMAVDQAGQFIQDQLPQFAALKVMQAAVPMIIAWALFAMLVIVSLICLAVCAHYRRKEIDRRETDNNITYWERHSRYRTDWDDYNSFIAFGYIGIASLLVMVCAIFITAFCAPELYGWSNYPEAMLIDMALKAV